MKRFSLVLFLCIVSLAYASLLHADDKPLNVMTGILPVSYFAERVGGTHVHVDVLVGPGQNPHVFELPPQQLVRVSEAQLAFWIGMPFEQALRKRAESLNPQLVSVDVQAGIPLRKLNASEHDTHDDHAHDNHAYETGDSDPHVWLNPRFAIKIAENIHAAFTKALPQYAADLDQNLAALRQELTRLDTSIAATLAPYKGSSFYVYHPAFGYFGDAYGLKQIPVEVDGKEPGARQLVELITNAKQEKVRMIFVQQQFSAKSAEVIAQAIGGAVIPLDDLAKDYCANLKLIAQRIQETLAVK